MEINKMKHDLNRIEFTVEEGFKNRVRLLAAKWNVKSNVAVQRAVDQALARQWNEDEKTMLRTLLAHSEELLQRLFP
jgi:hypothetical protein